MLLVHLSPLHLMSVLFLTSRSTSDCSQPTLRTPFSPATNIQPCQSVEKRPAKVHESPSPPTREPSSIVAQPFFVRAISCCPFHFSPHLNEPFDDLLKPSGLVVFHQTHNPLDIFIFPNHLTSSQETIRSPACHLRFHFNLPPCPIHHLVITWKAPIPHVFTEDPLIHEIEPEQRD